MNYHTKYNLGDTLWLFEFKKILKGKLYRIEVEQDSKNIGSPVVVNYCIETETGVWQFPESQENERFWLNREDLVDYIKETIIQDIVA